MGEIKQRGRKLCPLHLALLIKVRAEGYKTGYSGGTKRINIYKDNFVNLVWVNAYDVGEMHRLCGEPYGGTKSGGIAPGRKRLGYSTLGVSRRKRAGKGSPDEAPSRHSSKNVQDGTEAGGGTPSPGKEARYGS